MSIDKDSDSTRTRWYIHHLCFWNIAGTLLISVLAVTFTIPAFTSLAALSPLAFVFVPGACALWYLAVRALYLGFINAQYEFVATATELSWGWSHRPKNHVVVPTATLRRIDYHPDIDSDHPGKIEFITNDGSRFHLSPAFAERADYAKDILAFLLVSFPKLLIRDFSTAPAA